MTALALFLASVLAFAMGRLTAPAPAPRPATETEKALAEEQRLRHQAERERDFECVRRVSLQGLISRKRAEAKQLRRELEKVSKALAEANCSLVSLQVESGLVAKARVSA